MSFALTEALLSTGEKSVYFLLSTYGISKIPYVGSWLALVVALGNITTNYGDVSENAELLLTKTHISDIMAEQLQARVRYNMAKNVMYSSVKDAKQTANYLVFLVMARYDSEQQSISFFKSFPWYLEWRNRDSISHANDNLLILDEYQNRYINRYRRLIY